MVMVSRVVIAVMIVIVIVCVIVMMPMSAPAKHPKHADGKQDNQHARKESQPRLGLLDDVPLAERKRRNGENPDDNRVPHRSLDRERDGL